MFINPSTSGGHVSHTPFSTETFPFFIILLQNKVKNTNFLVTFSLLYISEVLSYYFSTMKCTNHVLDSCNFEMCTWFISLKGYICKILTKLLTNFFNF